MTRSSGALVTRMIVLVVGLTVGSLVAACSDSGGSDGPPTLDRIDGPAQVDPSFDPFAVDPTAPLVTEADG